MGFLRCSLLDRLSQRCPRMQWPTRATDFDLDLSQGLRARLCHGLWHVQQRCNHARHHGVWRQPEMPPLHCQVCHPGTISLHSQQNNDPPCLTFSATCPTFSATRQQLLTPWSPHSARHQHQPRRRCALRGRLCPLHRSGDCRGQRLVRTPSQVVGCGMLHALVLLLQF